MNIFYLSKNVVECAEQHCDKHVLKMVIEYGQLLCTAHRVLDGKPVLDRTPSGRKILRYVMDDPRMEMKLMKSTHAGVPIVKWLCASRENYSYLYELFIALAFEYHWRYGRDHNVLLRLGHVVEEPPKNIGNAPFSEPPQAMPERYHVEGDTIQAYRNFYVFDKMRFAKWDGKVRSRAVPAWFNPSDL